MKKSFKIGTLRCVKYIEKKAKLIILTSLKPLYFLFQHGSQHLTLPPKMYFNPSSYLSGATGPKLMILWLYK